MKRPSLRQLEYLVAVGDCLSFHKASRACHVTQPGLSAQIAQLESLLDARLFERDRRRVLVSRAGEALIPRARAILSAVDQFVEAAGALSEPLSGTIRLGVIPTIAPYLLPEVVPALRKRYPRVRLLLREEQTRTLVRLLDEGKLDLLLLALEADLGGAETLALFEDPFVLAMPADHPLAGKKRIDESNLRGVQVLLLEDGHCLRNQALSFCENAGATELGDFRATSLGTLAQMVASNLGVTLLPGMALPVEVGRRKNLVVRPFAKPVPHRTIGLAWRRTTLRKEEYRLLGEMLRPGASRQTKVRARL